MTPLRRRIIVIGGGLVAFVAAFAIVGLVSKSSPSTLAPSTTLAAAGTPVVPLESWYWTMAVSPTDPNVLVVGSSDGLLRSTDGGKTWKATGPKDVNVTSVVAAGGTIYAGGLPGSATGQPIAVNGKTRAAPAGTAVLASSTDGGVTWATLHPRGLPGVSIQSLAAETGDAKTVYALLTTGALFRSTDGAASFSPVLTKIGIPPWAIALTQDSTLLGGDMDTGSYTGTTGSSKAWQSVGLTDTKGTHMVMEYAVHPSDTSKVLMSSYGVELSTDGGKSWQPTLRSTVMFGPVAYAPSDGDVAYAVGFDRSLWRSDDGGITWADVTK